LTEDNQLSLSAAQEVKVAGVKIFCLMWAIRFALVWEYGGFVYPHEKICKGCGICGLRIYGDWEFD